MPDYLNLDGRMNLLRNAYIDMKTNQLPDYINTLKEKYNAKDLMVENIESAKEDFGGFLGRAAGNFDDIVKDLTGDPKNVLKNVSDFLKEGKDIREKTLAILGLMKNAKKGFWLALIQLIVDAAKLSLGKQQNNINNMIGVLGAADLPSDIRNAKVSKDSLIYAYNNVITSKKSLEAAREKLGSGGIVVKKLTDKAIIVLRNAEHKLAGEIADISKLGAIISSISNIELMEAKLATSAADYIIHYISTLLFIQAIYFIEHRVMKSKRVLDIEISDKILQDIILAIDNKTKKPMEAMQKRWETNPPSQIELVRDAAKYSKKTRLHWEKIEAYFGDNFENLLNLDVKSVDYAKLMVALQSDTYLNADRKTAGKNVKELASRAGVPAANVFSMSKGAKSSIFKSIRTKYTKELNSISINISRGRSALGNYGSHKSKLLEFINEGLVALGYQETPMLDFAMGRLIKTSDIIYGIPSVKEILSNNEIELIGIAISGDYKEKVQSEILSIATSSKATKIIISNRKAERTIENIMDLTIAQLNSEKEELAEEMSILEAGASGEVPKEFIQGKGI